MAPALDGGATMIGESDTAKPAQRRDQLLRWGEDCVSRRADQGFDAYMTSLGAADPLP